METIKTNILTLCQKKEIYQLWNDEYPENISYNSFSEFELYLEKLLNQFNLLLIDSNKNIQGWYFDFTRENEKWFAMILASKIQGKGFGSKLLNEAKKHNTELNGWVINHSNYLKSSGEPYLTPIPFYLKNNFKLLKETRLELENLSAVKIKWIK